jgi:hypothetical protein
MPTFRVSTDGHEIEIRSSLWSGREQVLCDGVIVSEKRSWQLTTAHGFEAVDKAGTRVVYEVNFFGGFTVGYALRRNGLLVAASPKNTVPDSTFHPDPEISQWNR